MTNLQIMDYEQNRKTVMRDVENSGAEKIDIRIIFGDEIADVKFPGGKTESYDSCPENQERTAEIVQGKYTLYKKGHMWPKAWDAREDAYDGQKIMTGKK